MKVYIAAPWADRLVAQGVSQQVKAAGFETTSSWIDKHADKPADSTGLDWDPKVLNAEAIEDIEDVLNSDVLLLLNTQHRGQETSGKAVETGVAIAGGKDVIVVGRPTNVFHMLFGVHRVTTIGEAIDVLRGIRDGVTEAEATV